MSNLPEVCIFHVELITLGRPAHVCRQGFHQDPSRKEGAYLVLAIELIMHSPP